MARHPVVLDPDLEDQIRKQYELRTGHRGAHGAIQDFLRRGIELAAKELGSQLRSTISPSEASARGNIKFPEDLSPRHKSALKSAVDIFRSTQETAKDIVVLYLKEIHRLVVIAERYEQQSKLVREMGTPPGVVETGSRPKKKVG